MQVKIKNQYLGSTFDFLYELPLKGRLSRHRTRFLKIIEDRLNLVVQEQEEIIKEHSHLDEDGNIKFLKDGKTPDIKNMSEFLAEREELYNEEMVIEGADNEAMLKSIRQILDECDVELSGTKANLYDYLCEQFKVDEDID